MTREFNRQRRGDLRPPFRGQPSNNYREERPSRPARPRLNRATVDRGWELGARSNHADYRPRTDTRRRPDGYADHAPQNGRRPYGERQDNRRPPFRSDGAQTRYPERPANGRRGNREESGYNGYNGSRGGRNGRPFQSQTRGQGSGYARWQSRPQAQNYGYQRGPRDYRSAPYEERFEGDYERFDAYEPSRRPPRSNGYRSQDQRSAPYTNERGSREKAPRRGSREDDPFWQEVEQESEQLVGRVRPRPAREHGHRGGQMKSRHAPKPRRKKAQSEGPVLRPSQRGFKWPTP